jgi:DNA polymerase
MPTYGGKLTENIVQAIARDCLAVAMLALAKAGYKIVMHIHDEVVIETDATELGNVCAIMGRAIPWAPGLLLRADGFATEFYRKD